MATSDSNTAFSDGFSSDTFPERRSQILKKFNDLRNRNSRDMFFERPFGSDWTANHSFSRSSFDSDSSPFPSRQTSNEIPIRVVHEKKSDDGSLDRDSMNSSFGSPNGKQHEARVEPRVHHIPIKVEPRDDNNTELSRSSSASSQRSAVSAGSAVSAQSLNDPGSPAFSTSPKSSGESSNGNKEHIIPITVESHVRPISKNTESPLASKLVKSKKVPPVPGQSQSTRSKNFAPAQHVTRVPVNQRETSDEDQSRKPPEHRNQQCLKPDPLKLIAMVIEEASSLEKQIEAFCGEYQDKTYLYLDEMLTRCILKLDNMDICGKDEVRQARKAAINFINKCIAALEAKANKMEVNVTSVDEPKEDSSQVNEQDNSVKDETEAVYNTVNAEFQKTSDKIPCENAEGDKMEMVEGSPENDNEENKQEQSDEKMAVEENKNETQQSNEAVDKIEEENQKSKCDDSELTSNDNTCSKSKELKHQMT